MNDSTLNCVSKEVGDALDFALSKSSFKAGSKGKKIIIEKYKNKNIEEIDWIDICKDIKSFGCYKFFLAFLIELLNKNQYVGSYKETLYSLLTDFKRLLNQPTSSFDILFCEDNIPKLLIFSYPIGRQKNMFIFIDEGNNFIRDEIKKLFNLNIPKYIEYTTLEYWKHFILSFSEYKKTINKIEDFNSNTFFAQINYYKNLYKEDKKKMSKAILCVINFYRYLVNQYNEYDFFKDSFTINKKLLFSNRLKQLLLEGYYFTNYSPNNHLGTKSKVCFLLKGYENLSTRLSNDDFMHFDISHVSNAQYRSFIWSYILSHLTHLLNKNISYIRNELKFIVDIKSHPDYPNSNLKHLNTQEALLVRSHINNKEASLGVRNNQLGAIRRFLNFCDEQKFITFDDIFFDYLKQIEEPTKNKAKSIPDDDLVLINKKLIEKSKTSIFWKEIYAIFHIALQTEFRISQICHLKIDCIKPTIKPNQFVIVTNTKTSHGAVDEFVITEITYKILMDIIDDTENLRDNCNIETDKDYIFLQEGTSSINLIKSHKFNDSLKKICKEVNLKNYYTASNLRDTHMTKAFEHILRSGKSDIEMGVLSKHRHIDTTQNHYIEMKLEEMLEATYGIIIGEELIETDSKIVDKIPDEINNKENEVENGCGNCTAKTCNLTSSLPCLACKDFITTINHEVYFIKAIDNVDRLIKNTTNAHDKEDLVTIKKLYVSYIIAINKKKEEIIND